MDIPDNLRRQHTRAFSRTEFQVSDLKATWVDLPYGSSYHQFARDQDHDTRTRTTSSSSNKGQYHCRPDGPTPSRPMEIIKREEPDTHSEYEPMQSFHTRQMRGNDITFNVRPAQSGTHSPERFSFARQSEQRTPHENTRRSDAFERPRRANTDTRHMSVFERAKVANLPDNAPRSTTIDFLDGKATIRDGMAYPLYKNGPDLAVPLPIPHSCRGLRLLWHMNGGIRWLNRRDRAFYWSEFERTERN